MTAPPIPTIAPSILSMRTPSKSFAVPGSFREPMLTAVQERDDEYSLTSAHVVFGEPIQRVAGRLGVIAIFNPGQVVAYQMQASTQTRLYMFRTLACPDPHRTRLPGIQPHVRLLLVAQTSRRSARARQILRELQKSGHNPSSLSDAFFLRAATTLAGRVPIDEVVASLLGPHAQCHPPAPEL